LAVGIGTVICGYVNAIAKRVNKFLCCRKIYEAEIQNRAVALVGKT
jgi:hypothetical protein